MLYHHCFEDELTESSGRQENPVKVKWRVSCMLASYLHGSQAFAFPWYLGAPGSIQCPAWSDTESLLVRNLWHGNVNFKPLQVSPSSPMNAYACKHTYTCMHTCTHTCTQAYKNSLSLTHTPAYNFFRLLFALVRCLCACRIYTTGCTFTKFSKHCLRPCIPFGRQSIKI